MFLMRENGNQGIAVLRDYRTSMIAVADGRIAGASVIHKFGRNPAVGTSYETVWAEGGLYQFRDSAASLTVSSDSEEDAPGSPGGTGAFTLTVMGLDADYNDITETVTLAGTAPVALSNSYLRVYRAFVTTVGSNGTNVGTVYIGSGTVTAGKPAQVDAAVGADFGQTQLGLYTVPAGTTAFGFAFRVFSARSGNANMDVRLRIRPNGGAWRVVNFFPMFQSNAIVERYIPFKAPEKTDIELQAVSSSGEQPVAVNLEFLLIDSTFEWT